MAVEMGFGGERSTSAASRKEQTLAYCVQLAQKDNCQEKSSASVEARFWTTHP